jgi:hypothetical protein
MIKNLFSWWVEKGDEKFVLSRKITISEGFSYDEDVSLIGKRIKLMCGLLDLDYSIMCHVDEIQVLCVAGRIQNTAGFMIMCEIAPDEFISFLIE